MSLKTEIRIDFAGERRSFDLSPIGCIRRLQDACDAGPHHVFSRLEDGSWRLDDLREPIAQGLIGGGMSQRDVHALMEKWFDPEPKVQFLPVAKGILLAWLVGAEDEPLGEPEGEDQTQTPSPVEKSASQPSTEAEQQ